MVSQQDEPSTTLRRLLASTKLQALRPRPQTPVVLRYEHTVEHVLEARFGLVCPCMLMEEDKLIRLDAKNTTSQVLAAKKVLSAPVVACSEGDAPDDCTDVIGFVDIRDILVSFLAGTDQPHPHVYSLISRYTYRYGAIAGLNRKEIEGKPMLQQMHHLEEAGKTFARKKLSEISELG